MAFFFGKKDKNLSDETSDRLQAEANPASSNEAESSVGPVISPIAGGMVARPRTAPPGASARMNRTQGAHSRATQRIALSINPSNGGAEGQSPKGATISLPVGMFLRLLPGEILSAPLAELERSNQLSREVFVSLSAILAQLPSGKVEMTLQELSEFIPEDLLQPKAALNPLLSTVVSLPLMEVVMRIPPDLLALRADQKDVDAAVLTTPDPFTLAGLRHNEEMRAAAAAEAAQTPPPQESTPAQEREPVANIIEENQVPQAEEFVPQVEMVRMETSSLTMPSIRKPITVTGPMNKSSAQPMPQVTRLPTPAQGNQSGSGKLPAGASTVAPPHAPIPGAEAPIVPRPSSAMPRAANAARRATAPIPRTSCATTAAARFGYHFSGS